MPPIRPIFMANQSKVGAYVLGLVKTSVPYGDFQVHTSVWWLNSLPSYTRMYILRWIRRYVSVGKYLRLTLSLFYPTAICFRCTFTWERVIGLKWVKGGYMPKPLYCTYAFSYFARHLSMLEFFEWHND